MASKTPSPALAALVTRSYPIEADVWADFWQRLGAKELHPGEAVAVLSSLTTQMPDGASVSALLGSLRTGNPQPAGPARTTVNIVGTGGGPSTFNLSTASAFVAAAMGTRVIKTGSRAYASRTGSVDLLDRLGIRMAGSYEELEQLLDTFGIACAGPFVYPKELRLLARQILPFDMKTVGRFFNLVGPFLAAVPVTTQITGVSDHSVLPVFRALAREDPTRDYWLCWNDLGCDELLSVTDGHVFDSAADAERVITPGELGLTDRPFEDLLPVAELDDTVPHFLKLISGDGPTGAIESIRLNAAVLAINGGVREDWAGALKLAEETMTSGEAARLIERIRAHGAVGARQAAVAFFSEPLPGRPGLALFLNAGDPPLDVFRKLVLMLDAAKVDCLELAIPFPNSASDGPVIRESASRALADGVDADAVLGFIAGVRPELTHLKIALLADWSYSIKRTPLPEFLARVKQAGADGLLVHGLPPRLRTQYYDAAREVGQPIVTTCYATSEPAVLDEAAEHGSAYIYLVAAYGRSGTVGPPDHAALVPVMERLRAASTVPIAVGFGVKTQAHIEGLGAVGADAAIVGSECVARVSAAQAAGRDVVEDFKGLLVELGHVPDSAAAKPVR